MGSYTTWFNLRHRRSGLLFQGRYKSFLVEEGEYLLKLSRLSAPQPGARESAGQRQSGGAAAWVALEQLSRLRRAGRTGVKR